MTESRLNTDATASGREMSHSGKTYFARSRELTKSGNSVVSTLPKDVLRNHGLVDEEDEPVDNAYVQPYIDHDREVLGVEVPLTDD
jgi:hypothetical protein